MTLDQLLDALANEEVVDVALYTREAELFAEKVKDGKKIAELFRRIAAEEARHLASLREISGFRSGLKVRRPETGNSLTATLRRHEDRELKSVNLYHKLLPLLREERHRLLVREIAAQEEEHLASIRKYARSLKRP